MSFGARATETIDPARSAQMALVRSKDTKPEIIVRKIIDDLRRKYSLHSSKLPGKPDIVFFRARKVIFVHGCFWHQHKSQTCWRSRVPKTRQDFWIPKLKANSARDRANVSALRKAGWKVLIVWECQTSQRKRVSLVAKIQKFLKT